jgi:hypothetical protein
MTIVLIILVLLLIGVIPAWPYSRGWGVYPSGGVGLILLIVIILLLLKVIWASFIFGQSGIYFTQSGSKIPGWTGDPDSATRWLLSARYRT